MKIKNICLDTKNNQYQIKAGDMLVEMEYSPNNKKIEEYMLNILRQKIKWADFSNSIRYTTKEGR
ncbi:MAG: hypothetical protein ACLTBX_06875 [Clostridia bacterium]